MNTSTMAEQATPEAGNLFSAFQERRTSNNRRWLLALAVPLLGVVAAWVSLQGRPSSVHIITANGVKMVSLGMSQQDVLSRLGKPIGRQTRADGLECFQHGMFSLLEPSTTIYTVCYAGGVLKDVTARRYSMWEADPSGNFIPAGMPTGNVAEPGKAAPAARP